MHGTIQSLVAFYTPGQVVNYIHFIGFFRNGGRCHFTDYAGVLVYREVSIST